MPQDLLYDHPRYYEIAFSFRNIEAEAAFLHTCIQRFSPIDVRRVLEIACGPAPHAGNLVDRGYHYVGIDINPSMLNYAEAKWRHLGSRVELHEADMTCFTLNPPADFAFVMLGSLYLNSLSDMTSHFDCAARALRPGALYFLDLCVQFNDPLIGRIKSAFETRVDGISVKSRFDTRLVDSAQQLYEEIWTVNVDDNGRRRDFQMIERNRAVFPQEFLLFLNTRTDFEFVGWWHDWNLKKPIEATSEVIRPVVIIRRK